MRYLRMVRGRMPRSGAAMLLCAIAALMVMGGGAYATTLITGAQVKDHSLTGKDIKNHSLSAKVFKRGVIRAGKDGAPGAAGANGAKGAKGATGAAGSAGASAYQVWLSEG